jgi:hypothetical protein
MDAEPGQVFDGSSLLQTDRGLLSVRAVFNRLQFRGSEE